MAHFLGSFLISWGSKKQNLVALSEVEYVVAVLCYSQLMWIKKQLDDFRILSDCVPLFRDNKSTRNMAKNIVQSKKTNILTSCITFSEIIWRMD